MGCFDYINIDCPHCGETVEDQTKAGDCGMNSYSLGDDTMMDVIIADNYWSPCFNCGGSFYVKQIQKPIYEVMKGKNSEL